MMAEFGFKAYQFLLPWAWLTLALAIVVLGPLAIFRRTRQTAGVGLILASWIFGATTWFLGLTITLATWGWLAVFIGLLLGGIGVVPIAVLAAFITLGSVSLGVSLLVMCVITFGSRMVGATLLDT